MRPTSYETAVIMGLNMGLHAALDHGLANIVAVCKSPEATNKVTPSLTANFRVLLHVTVPDSCIVPVKYGIIIVSP